MVPSHFEPRHLGYPNYVKNILRIKAINYACFKLEEKATESAKKEDKQFYQCYRRLAMSIR